MNVKSIDYKKITLKKQTSKQNKRAKKKKDYDMSGFPAIKSTHYTFKHQ